MSAATTAAPTARLASVSTIIMAGVLGGLVDFVYPSLMALARGRPLESPWRSVASGWIGKAASEGAAPVALGVVTHFGIAIVMAATFALAAMRLPVLVRRPVSSGVLYGFVLYAVMYGIVLPTRFGRPYHWNGVISVLDIAAHVGVGLAIALVLAWRRPAER
jgi:hypothetical protein